MIKSNSSGNVWGLSLGSTSWAADCVDCDSGVSVRHRLPGSRSSTPSLLLPRLPGEPVRLDIWSPVHIRGSGAKWPIEAKIDEAVGSGRMPVAAAWTARNQSFLTDETTHHDPVWKWRIDDVSHELNPIDGLASAMAQMGQWFGQKAPVTITIPNNFRQSEQQLVIDRCRALEVDVTLLWSPIAAALAWLDRFDSVLKNLPESKRNLLYVHVDWGTINYTELKIVSRHESSSRKWLPVRSRPQKEDALPGFGWAVEAHSRSSMSLTERWIRLIGSGSAFDLKGAGRLENPTLLGSIQKWKTAFVSPYAHIDSFKKRLTDKPGGYAGIVITGDFADFACDGETTLKLILDLYAPKSSETSIVASGVEGDRLLANGAAIFANDRLHDVVSYLDTLPELDLFIETSGKFDWLPLLGGQDEFVPGGQTWKRTEPIRGLAVRRGASAVRLVVAHEEFTGVREIAALLPESAEQRLAAELHVSAIPAQGNASLMLNLFDETSTTTLGRIHADWKRMRPIYDDDDAPMDKASYLQSQPKAFPELMPRKSSYSCWMRLQSRINEFTHRLTTPNRLISDVAFLRRLNHIVQQKDSSQYPADATAIGSDFRSPGSDKALLEFAKGLLQLWQINIDRPGDGMNMVVRILGYLSVDQFEFENWLIGNVKSSQHDTNAIKQSFGLCARNPDNIARFMTFIFAGGTAKSNDLKSASQILRYRSNATEKMTNELCANVLATSLRIFEQELADWGRSFSFRWSSLIVVYILRRRMFDSGFADPDEELATRAKDLFSKAIARSRSGRLRPMGGSVDLPAAFQQMIDYIDKKGRGDILMAAEN